jgi:sulfate adenylyltransferase subunit 2
MRQILIPTYNLKDKTNKIVPWDTSQVQKYTQKDISKTSLRAAERLIEKSEIIPEPIRYQDVLDEKNCSLKSKVLNEQLLIAKKKRNLIYTMQLSKVDKKLYVLLANDGRSGRKWFWLKEEDLTSSFIESCLVALLRNTGKNICFIASGGLVEYFRIIDHKMVDQIIVIYKKTIGTFPSSAYQEYLVKKDSKTKPSSRILSTSHLDNLENESIHIMREVIAEAENPVMLYSIGKDSAVMLHLALKAFYPNVPPFPLLHVDTGWKFQMMYEFRDQITAKTGMQLIIHKNQDGLDNNINPFDSGSQKHTEIMKTVALKQVLDKMNYDVAFGGARRDEEKSRAKERIFSFRDEFHRWDPKNQRPEVWNLYNGRINKGESIRAFPLSNWTELDIWEYIYRENIDIVPLYFAAPRPVVIRNEGILLVDDNRFKFEKNDKVEIKKVRFRTLGCYPLTNAMESEASDLSSIILEVLNSRVSERQGRLIDNDESASMEKKKVEGYF